MELNKTIYTIDARENIYLESMAKAIKLDDEAVYDVIQQMFAEFLVETKKVELNYLDLKNCLTPQKQKLEIAFVFDSLKTGSDTYGAKIMSKLLSLFDKKTCNSILVGDFIGPPQAASALKQAFFHFLKQEKEINYISNDLFFIVYIIIYQIMPSIR